MSLSERHRKWGWDCPAVDIDFLFLEYDRGQPVAIVEYKQERAALVCAAHPTYQAMITLGTRAKIPVFVVRYKSDFSEWQVSPLNDFAKAACIGICGIMTEREFVAFLYMIRGYEVPQSVLDGLGALL